MEASRPPRAALLALSGFLGGAAVAVLYARGFSRTRRLNELADIHEKDVSVLRGSLLQWKVHVGVRQQLRSIAATRFEHELQHRRKRLLTVCLRQWVVSFRL